MRVMISALLLTGLLCGTTAAQTAKLEVGLAQYGLQDATAFPVVVDGVPAWLLYHPTGEFQVARVHPRRSGLMAWNPTPGLCLELMWYLPVRGWWYVVGAGPKDADHDGNDDLTVRSIDGTNRLAVIGLHFNYCK